MPSPTIAIIGAGFSGTVLSLWLQSFAQPGSRVLLIERSGRFACGLAYGSAGANHLLNVPAGRMSAFPDLPLDFLRWLEAESTPERDAMPPGAGDFVPRHLYGRYLRHLLDQALDDMRSVSIELVCGHVVDVEHASPEIRLRMASGEVLCADLAVLAIGNLPAEAPHSGGAAALRDAGIWQDEPWTPTALADLATDASVLLVGTGLTMVDVAIALLDAGHIGPIHALSRHGLLPRRHAAQHSPAALLPSPLPNALRPLVRYMRREIANACGAGGDWRAVIDALRPFTQDLWRGMSVTERARFRRHLCTWWDVHRHRMAPEIADRIAAAQARGQLQVHAGRIVRSVVRRGQATVVFRRRGTAELRALPVGGAINCTGPCADVTRSSDPLMRSLLRSGLARPDPLHLGLDVASDGAVLDRAGARSNRLFAIGPPTKGVNWEITAVPDIRRQCREMAGTLRSLVGAGVKSSPALQLS